jgi:SET and MYND domain-containing protein
MQSLLTNEDRENLSLETQESFTHFAQSLVLYLDVSSPEELRAFGIDSARELVDLMSKVRSTP